ncbi:SPOC domain-containing protein 1 [Leptodactylus fuscus]
MEKLPNGIPSEPNERECHSPLGLFEKFKLEIPSDAISSPDPELPTSSVSEFPSPWETEDFVINPSFENANKLILSKSSVIERMRRMMNTVSAATNEEDDLQPNGVKVVFYREENESCKLLGSWNADSREVELLDELENPGQTELEGPILIQDESDDDDVILCEEDGQLSQRKDKCLLDTGRSAHNLQTTCNPTHLKVKLRKRKSKMKTPDMHDSLAMTSTKPSKRIRDTTVQALYEVLVKRIKEIENLNIPDETLKKMAEHVEEELYSLYHNTGMRYKSKYRSLIFNLKDPKNKVFFRRVVLGEISPQCLVQMTPTEMAYQELTNWRNQERQHALEMIERTEKETNLKQQMTKLTHKGLIEIDVAPDQMFSLEDLSDAPWCSKDLQSTDVKNIEEKTTDTTAQHKTHLLDLNCLICMGKMKPSDMMDMSQWTKVKLTKNLQENGHGEKLPSSEAGAVIDGIEKDVIGAKRQKPSLSQSTALWKGFIQMFAIKQFKVTAERVSGYFTHLCQELPKIITSKGFICQESVWEYMDLIWPACTKDMCLLRFCPQTSSDAVFYSRLYSYLNRKLRYVIINTNKMEAFIIPLPACQPIPSNLRPLGGPGLDDDHPHLLLALLLPNHPSWSSCSRKVNKIQKEEELDVPDDIFSSILEDVEKEEKEMAEQGLPSVGQESTGVGEVGMPELMNILCLLSNNMQEIAAQNNNNFPIVSPSSQPDSTPVPGYNMVWPPYVMAPNFQAPAYDNNANAMFDSSSMFGSSGFNPMF